MSKLISVFIVEDNLSHLNLLKLKVEHLGYRISGTNQTAEDALYHIEKESPDIVLLDINLSRDNDGIVLAKQIKNRLAIPIIFITAHSEDEIIKNAIAVEPSGYLVKPVDLGDLKASIELALHKRAKSNHDEEYTIAKSEKEFLSVRTGQKLQLLPFKEVKLLKIDVKNYVTLVNNKNKEFAIRDSLKNLMNSVLPDCFIRTHHSYAVNIDYILFIDEKEQVLYLKTNDHIPIGKSFKELVYQKMNIKA
jgi:DNA-binding LytR/AlgR family response regulator